MANNIFSPKSTYTYGQVPTNSNAAYNVWGSTGAYNPYIVFGPGYTPGLYNPNTGQPLPQQPIQPVSSSGDDSFPDTTPVGDGSSFGGSGSNSIFGGGVAGASTSPGYTGPYDQGNPLATGNQGFMNELGKAINDYFSSGGIIGGVINAFSGTPTAPKTYDPIQYAQEVGVAEGATAPVTFSSPGLAQATVGTGGTISGSVTGDKGPSTVSWTGTDADGNTTGTITTDSMGTTGVTSYGGGAYSVDVGDTVQGEVGWEDPGTTSSSSSDNGSKIVCTAMNEDYGFGSYRNAIWLKYAELNYKDKPEMEVGYHAIFRPLLKIRKKWYGKPIYAWMKHVARHRSVDLRAEMYGKKRDRIGQFWRILLEPLCYFVGKRISKGDKDGK